MIPLRPVQTERGTPHCQGRVALIAEVADAVTTVPDPVPALADTAQALPAWAHQDCPGTGLSFAWTQRHSQCGRRGSQGRARTAIAKLTLIRYYYVMRYTSERSTDPGLLVLTSLAEGPKHGYAITHDVEQLAGVRLGPGTLYGALARLESNGLIKALPAEDRRRPYRLTGAGSAALSEQLQALEHVARSGLARLRVAKALQ